VKSYPRLRSSSQGKGKKVPSALKITKNTNTVPITNPKQTTFFEALGKIWGTLYLLRNPGM
jgi:hypothetical protein